MISILIPTKGRHDRLQNLLENIFSTAFEPSKVEVCFYVDNDDISTIGVLEKIKKDFNIFFTKGENVVFSDMWNKCAEIASGEFFMICGDDVVFETQHWDKKILEAFDKFKPSYIGYVAVNDVIHADGSLGVHGVVHRNWYKVLSYVTPKIFIYNYADNWVDDIAKMIGRREFLKDVVVRHNHWIVNNSLFDNTYEKNYNNYKKVQSSVDSLYVSTFLERKKDADKLLEFIHKFEGD
jgi:hypothetical protein